MHKIFIYIKFSLKALFRYPGGNTLNAIFKYARPWFRYNDLTKNSVNERIPWLCFSAIDRIKKLVHNDMAVFEYGSGESTLFWASRVKKVISVEHDRLWYKKMTTKFSSHHITNIQYILSEAEPDNEFNGKHIESPTDYISGDRNFTESKFASYVMQIDRYPDNYFDVIIVDGRARPSCIQHAMPKLNLNGFLVVDNTERKYYQTAIKLISNRNWKKWSSYGPVPYSLSFSETSIFQKIKL